MEENRGGGCCVFIIGLKELLQLPEHGNVTNRLNLCINGLLISICTGFTLLMVDDAFLLVKKQMSMDLCNGLDRSCWSLSGGFMHLLRCL